MSNWVKVRAEEIRRAEQERKTAGDLQVAMANDLKAKFAPFWSELLGVIEQSVTDFNAEFPETERRIDHFDKVASSMFIRRAAYPSASVKITLNNAGASAQYSISRTPRKGSNPIEKQATVTFALADGVIRYVEEGFSTHEDLAKVLLEPFFEF